MMDQSQFDDDDSNPSVNGWIKKEIDDDDFEEYMKHEQEEEHSGDKYEELMGMAKEELVARILQQEEDIRYLQDIRQGLEKNVQGFSTSCVQFKKLLEVMASTVTNLKAYQPSSSTSMASNSRPVGGATASAPAAVRQATNAPSSQASPRNTPTMPITASASPRSTPSIPTTSSNSRSTQNSSNVPSSHMTSSAVSNDRLHSGSSVSSHQTVTITRQTNVIIKTEIPSPPPEPVITHTPPMSSANMSSSTMSLTNQKMRNEASSFYQVRQQQQTANNMKTFTPNSSRSITDIANSIPSHRQRTRNTAAMFPSNASGTARLGNQGNKANMQQMFHAQRQSSPMSSATSFQANHVARGRGQMHQRSVPYPTQKPAQAVCSPALSRGRAMASQNFQNTSSSPSGVNNLLANMSVKVPSGITLSIVPTSQQKNMQSNPDRGMGNAIVRPIPTDGNNRTLTGSEDPCLTSKSPNDKGMANAAGPASNKALNQGNLPNEEEEEECEVAVLEPDEKKVAIDGQNLGDNSNSKASIVAEVLSESQCDNDSAFWNSQSMVQKGHQSFQNNAEYMFEESEDIDSDENDTKIYLGENVSLPRELVDSCIKQGPNPTKLTRNLMKALFPDLRELANGCAEGDGNRALQPMLPANKVKAIVALVQKTFPQVKRSAVISVMNMKCKEARTALASRSGSQQYSNY